ncbi:DUF418 domain-containing protein [Aneurinibacillus sp. REN35]|uniref:DUF418 domain-containing protein n=1 Tax=Aneurinibacillus sp. REN35 TaxID=3237286 RepID=UPI00352773C1
MRATPVSGHSRIVSLDIIRGFALFGILLVNMPAFHSPAFIRQIYTLPQHLSPLDNGIRIFFDMFVQTKFYTMFSFLFGLGFYIFMRRAEQKNIKSAGLFARRLLILLVFGLLHLIFLWFGDILHTYALVGFLLLLFYKRSNTALIGWGLGLLCSYYALLALQLVVEPTSSYAAQQQVISAAKLEEAVRMYQDASYTEWLAYRLQAEVTLILSNAPFLIPAILPLFLFGLYAGRRGIFQHPEQHRTFVTRVWIISLLISAPLVAAVALVHMDILAFDANKPLAIQLFVTMSGAPLCLFYISSFVLLLQKQSWQKRLRPLGFVGQMALTNYIMQTALSLAVIYGFDLFNRMSLAFGTFLCVGIYGLQIVYSRFWLTRYRFGPLEWLWRSLTYGYFQPLRREHIRSAK